MSKELKNIYNDRLVDYINYYRRYPTEFFKEILGVELNKAQEKVLKKYFEEYKKGKTFVRPRQTEIGEFGLGVAALYGNNSLI